MAFLEVKRNSLPRAGSECHVTNHLSQLATIISRKDKAPITLLVSLAAPRAGPDRLLCQVGEPPSWT